MFREHRILAIIPARGGSKGLPGKNTRELGGKPLIAWSIAAGRQSGFVDEVAVSTDSPEIAAQASNYGAAVPFLRPEALATDEAKTIDVILHTIAWYDNQAVTFDLVLLLQPTSPLRTAADINLALELYFSKGAQAIVSVCQADHHPWWSNVLPADGGMQEFLRPECLNAGRQKLPVYYRLNGAIYLADIDFLKRNRSFWGEKTFAYLMPKERSVDIDDIVDFRLAEVLMATR